MLYPQLFQPIKIGPISVKNRIVMPAMNTNFADPQGFVSRRLLDYYLARAEGGVGLIISSAAVVDEKAKRRTGNLAIYDDVFVDGLANLAKEIRSAGSRIFQQLNHVGRLARTMTIPDSKYQPAGPSSIPHPVTGEKCKELTISEIEEIVTRFANGARRVKEAGFDGLEVHGAHGYLLNQFLSPYTNRRNDQYGGSLDARMKFPLQIVKEVRIVVGEDFPISYRISAKEFVPGGLDFEEIRTFASELDKAGVNVIHVSGGGSETPATVLRMIPTMSAERGCFVSCAEKIKEVVSIPVIVVGKINTPDLAEEIIREEKSDMVAMGRALIADPELPIKAKNGQVRDIRNCIYCNQGCIERLIQEMDITCTVNPAVGKEKEYKPVPAETAKKVFIIGGGAAGLEAATTSAMRGHNVTLFEKEGQLGGQMQIASVPPGKDEIKNIIKYYSNQLVKFGITVKLNIEVTTSYIEKEEADRVVLATGANPIQSQIPQLQNVVMAHDVLKNNLQLVDEVAVVGGGQVGLEVASFLAQRGNKVKVIEMLEDVGGDMGPLNKYHLKENLENLGVDILCNTEFVRAGKDLIEVRKHGKRETISNIKTVIIAIGSEPNDILVHECKKSSWQGEVFKIGDCAEPRKILDAIYEGFKVGLGI